MMLAACRRARIPARYVSGYLYDPRSRQAGRVARLGRRSRRRARLGLARPDPRPRTDRAYVRVAVGRDYADVPPTRGVFKGTAAETLDVAVRIAVQ